MKQHRFWRIAISLGLVMCLFSGTVSTPAAAKTTSQMQSDLASLEQKSKQLESEIAGLKKQKAEQQKLKEKLQQQIDNTQQEIAACTTLINGYKSEISQYEKEIAAKEQEIEQTKYLYKQRMRSIYMSGSTNNDLMVLIDADSFADYLALSEVSKSISAHDKKLVNTITDAIGVINTAKAAIDQKLSAQNSVKQTLANKQAQLKAQQAEINGVISSISSNQQSLEKENKTYEAAIDKLESEIQAALRGSGGSNPVFVSGTFIWPVPGYYNITSYFGQRWGRLHGGIDIASAGIYGKPIVAAADGVVAAAGYNTGGYGNWVMINHGTNGGKQYATVYGHMCKRPSVSTGQSVKQGQTIGYVGSTGNSTGNHLHFEIRVNGSRVNPLNYFKRAS